MGRFSVEWSSTSDSYMSDETACEKLLLSSQTLSDFGYGPSHAQKLPPAMASVEAIGSISPVVSICTGAFSTFGALSVVGGAPLFPQAASNRMGRSLSSFFMGAMRQFWPGGSWRYSSAVPGMEANTFRCPDAIAMPRGACCVPWGLLLAPRP